MKKRIIISLLGFLSLQLYAASGPLLNIISDAKSYVFQVRCEWPQVAFNKPCDQYNCLLYGAGQKIPFAKESGYDVPKGTHKIVGVMGSSDRPIRLIIQAYAYSEKATTDFYRGAVATKDPKIFYIHHPGNVNVELVANYSKITGYSLKSKTSGVTIK